MIIQFIIIGSAFILTGLVLLYFLFDTLKDSLYNLQRDRYLQAGLDLLMAVVYLGVTGYIVLYGVFLLSKGR